jgi:hypothetical protein
MVNIKRILSISNSQGTSAGLGDEFLFSNYLLLIQQMMPEVDCRYWMMSYLSVVTLNDLFREIVMPHQPDLVILQCGIIEAGLRILPKSTRDILGILPGGRLVTGFLHKRQAKVRKALNLLGIRFLDVNLHQFERCLFEIIKKCEFFNYKLMTA